LKTGKIFSIGPIAFTYSYPFKTLIYLIERESNVAITSRRLMKALQMGEICPMERLDYVSDREKIGSGLPSAGICGS